MDDRTRPTINAARVSPWLDTSRVVNGAYPIRYGVQVRVGRQWRHLAVNNEAAIFDTPEQARANADEIMRQVAVDV